MIDLPHLSPSAFASVFEEMHDCEPFPWQVALAEQVCRDGRWPALLDLPTGAGKTAALDIALFHLAVEAGNGEARRAATRIALVVDRRIVVDEAFDRAERIAAKLATATGDTPLGRMAARLRSLTGADCPPVLAQRLRGGLPMEVDWERNPCQPLLIASTIDQVGSRLLFRGYGVSDSMKPVHAGLIGSDCLILIDEAHLARPFRQTLDRVKHTRNGTRSSGADPWGFAILTATPGADRNSAFGLTDAERNAAAEDATPAGRLRQRLVARKRTHLGKPSKDITDDGVDAVSAMLERFRASGLTAPVIGVITNRVARARAMFEKLQEAHGPLDGADRATAEIALLIGPSRPYDRAQVVRRLDAIKTGDPKRNALERPLIVVATQCIEVGADLDFDGLVTECAALDALRQRFGRLNRGGRNIEAEATVLIAKSDLSAKARSDGDPVYGQALAATWNWLVANATDHSVDFGFEAMDQLLEATAEETRATLRGVEASAPVLCPAHLDLLVQTSPRPEPDLDIALFLHGPERPSADVGIVWRADLEQADLGDEERRAAYIETLAALPPRTDEVLRVPIWAARRLLLDLAAGKSAPRRQPPDLADAHEATPDEAGALSRQGRPVLRWAGADDIATQQIHASEIRVGDTIVLPATYGGCDEYGWAPGDRRAVRDLADQAAEPYHARRCAFRLHPACFDPPGSDALPGAADDGEARRQSVARVLELILADAGGKAKDVLRATAGEATALSMSQAQGTLLSEIQQRRHLRLLRRGRRDAAGRAVTFAATVLALGGTGDAATETDAEGLTASAAVTLDEHAKLVERIACSFARGLPPSIVEAVAVAAFLHDAGKVDPRFQRLLVGARGWNRPDVGSDGKSTVLAKSARTLVGSAGREARRVAGLPDDWRRHEALSVSLALGHPRLGQSADQRQLALYLIGTHHGQGRPWFRHDDPINDAGRPIAAAALGVTVWQTVTGPHSPLFDCEGLDWPGLAAKLCAEYGPWRLALLEAILRLADHRASAQADANAIPLSQKGAAT